jgi:hypothetical protein
MSDAFEDMRRMMAIYKANAELLDPERDKIALTKWSELEQLLNERDTAFEDLKRLHEITEELRKPQVDLVKGTAMKYERDRIFAFYAGRFPPTGGFQ